MGVVMQLEQVAVEKWGSMAEVEQERNNREQKRLKRALESAGLAMQGLWTCNFLPCLDVLPQQS